MSALMDITHKIIDHDDTVEMLRLADNYCHMYRLMGPDKFVLPAAAAPLLPIIEAYASRPQAFLRYVQVVRDAVHDAYPGSDKLVSVQEFYRGIVVRVAQFELRDRKKRVMLWLSKEYPEATTEQRHAYAAKMEKQWTKLRRSILAAERKQAGGRLTMSRVSEITEEFWKMVDDDIDSGKLPPLE